jgi:hypothetical protein
MLNMPKNGLTFSSKGTIMALTQAQLKELAKTKKSEKIESNLSQIEGLGLFVLDNNFDRKTGESYASLRIGEGKHTAQMAFSIQAYAFGVVARQANQQDVESVDAPIEGLYADAYARAAIHKEIDKAGGNLELIGLELNPLTKKATENPVTINFTKDSVTATWEYADGTSKTLPIRSGIWTQAIRVNANGAKRQAQSAERVKAMYADAAKPAGKGKAKAK